MPITNLFIDSISIVVISTCIVNIGKHILGKIWPNHWGFFWCSSDTSTLWTCLSLGNSCGFMGSCKDVHHWYLLTPEKFCQQRLFYSSILNIDKSLFFGLVFEKEGDDMIVGKYMDHAWLLKILEIPSEIHSSVKLMSLSSCRCFGNSRLYCLRLKVIRNGRM